MTNAPRSDPMHLQSILVATVLTAALSSAVYAAEDIVISDPISRATPAGAPTGVGYMTITNNGNTPDRLVSASSPMVDHVEIHEMAVTDGIMTMHPVPGGLVLPAHGSVTLKPGSFHLMLIGPKQPLRAGDMVPLTLTFEHMRTQQVSLAVKPLGEVLPPVSK